jgi:tRNA(Ile)-lysidine synthase TilS/MesJ
MQTRICKHCREELPIERFSMNKKAGKQYRFWKCNSCRHAGNQLLKESALHRKFNALAAWPVARMK